MQIQAACPLHSIPVNVVCLSQTCKNRVNCEVCIKKHKHKYFLDQTRQWKYLKEVGENIICKLKEYKTYKKANILNLQLNEYRDEVMKYFENEEIYLQSKITEDTLNFTLEMQRTSEKVTTVITQVKADILACWERYYADSMKYYNCEEEVQELETHFQEIDVSASKDVEESITFLYSQEMYLKFNLQLDSLKSRVAHYQKHARDLTQWLTTTRKKYQELEVFHAKTFQKWRQMYQEKPYIPSFVEEKSQFAVWENRFLTKNQEQNPSYKDVLQYKLRYETLRPVYRMARIDNQRFASSGARAIDIWNRVSYHPMKSIVFEYPTYGITNFVDQQGQTKILFGLSNGDLYDLDVSTFQTRRLQQAHMSAIKEIKQFNNKIFLTVSQDWLIKIWDNSSNPNQQEFATLKSTMNKHSGKLSTLQIIQDRVVSAGTDGTIKLWNINKLVVEETYDQQREVNALESIREELFASGGQIRQLRLWDYRIPKTPVSKYGIELFCNSILKVDQNKILFNDKNALKMVDLRKLDSPVLIYKQEQAFSGIISHIEYLGDKEIGTGGSDNFIVVWKC